MSRHVIIVSPHFPPSTLAGVHRARHLAKHLPSVGWRPTILRADESTYPEPPDPGLAALVPDTVEQVRTGAFPAEVCRRFGFGDIGLRGYPQMARTLHGLVRSERPDVVFITGSPFYPLMLGRALRRRFNVPVVLDFQDPWVSAHGATQPRLSKAGASHALAELLEPLALRAACEVTSVSDVQNDQMAARYPWLDRARMTAIPIGGDPEDFAALRAAPPDGRAVVLDPDLINLSYVGAFLPRAEPVARVVLRGLAALRARSPQLANRMRFNFIGTSNQPNGYDDPKVLPIARQEGVSDLVRETSQRIPFLDALSVLATSNGLLLIGSDEPHYTASKIYPALMSGRPFLSVFHARSSAHGILSTAGGGVSLAFETADDLARLADGVAQALERIATQPRGLGRADPAAYANVTAQAVSRRFAEVFERAARP